MHQKVHIVQDERVLGGKPIFTGTRISLDHMLAHIKDGYKPEEYAQMYNLTIEQAEAGLEWLKENKQLV